MLSKIVLLILLLSLPAIAKDRHWQTGKLLDVTRSSSLAKSVMRGETDGNGTFSGISKPKETAQYTYTIQGASQTFTSFREPFLSQGKDCKLTVNGPVKFAVENDHLYILDEANKEWNTKIVKKTANP